MINSEPATCHALSRSQLDCEVPPQPTPPAGPVPVTLAIYDVRGRRLTSLFTGRLTGGAAHLFTWDGTDDRGRRVASGVYFSRVSVGGRVETRKMLVLR